MINLSPLKFILGEVNQQVITIKNTHEKPITFKIKSRHPKLYQVSPYIGIISANQQLDVVFKTTAQFLPEQVSDEFLVVSDFIAEELNAEDFWKNNIGAYNNIIKIEAVDKQSAELFEQAQLIQELTSELSDLKLKYKKLSRLSPKFDDGQGMEFSLGQVFVTIILALIIGSIL